MNRKEVFQKVRSHLLTQNARSIQRGTCMYKSPSGLKCAIGIFMQDFSNVEGKSLPNPDVVNQLVQVLGELSQEDIGFLKELQIIHDCNQTFDWPVLLSQFEAKWELA